LRVARRRRAERFYACGALQLSRAARSTRTLGHIPQVVAEMTNEQLQARVRLLRRLGWLALVGILLLVVVSTILREDLEFHQPLTALAVLSVLPAVFYAVLLVIWHWKSRYHGTHSDLWGAVLVLEVSGWLKVIYLFRHVIPDSRGTGRYARASK
jgi:cytochrome bd-type quinol oxidase subunit 2